MRKKVAIQERDKLLLKKLTKAFDLPIFSDSHNNASDVRNVNGQNVCQIKNVRVELKDINAKVQASQKTVCFIYILICTHAFTNIYIYISCYVNN